MSGKAALVTGAGRGIGHAIAMGLAEAGGTIGLVARSGPELAETARHVHELGGTPLVISADLGDPGQLIELVQRVCDELGTVDILVSNADMVSPLGPSVSVDVDEWAASIAINVVAVAKLTFALLPALLDRKWGCIVNVSSGIAARPASMIGGNAYATGKAALEAHTVNLAAELADSGVTVNVFRPGPVDTAMQAWIRAQDPARIGAALHDRFSRSYETGTLITPGQSRALAAGSPANRGHRPGVGRI